MDGCSVWGTKSLFAQKDGACDNDCECASARECLCEGGAAALALRCTDTVRAGVPEWVYVELQGGGNDDVTVTQHLQACIGECDTDAHCAAGLKCFLRSGYTKVPGCKGQGNRDWDYCYDPSRVTPSSPLVSSTCQKYKDSKWCTLDGGYGTGWLSSYGSFSTFANSEGVDASQACCACGGGKTSYVSHPSTPNYPPP